MTPELLALAGLALVWALLAAQPALRALGGARRTAMVRRSVCGRATRPSTSRATEHAASTTERALDRAHSSPTWGRRAQGSAGLAAGASTGGERLGTIDRVHARECDCGRTVVAGSPRGLARRWAEHQARHQWAA